VREVGCGRSRVGRRETEIILLPQLLEILQVVDQHKNFRPDHLGFLPPFQFRRQGGHDFGETGIARLGDRLRDGLNDALKKIRLRISRPKVVQHEKLRAALRILRRQRHQRDRQNSEHPIIALTCHEQVGRALMAEDRFGWALDGIGSTQPGAGDLRPNQRRRRSMTGAMLLC